MKKSSEVTLGSGKYWRLFRKKNEPVWYNLNYTSKIQQTMIEFGSYTVLSVWSQCKTWLNLMLVPLGDVRSLLKAACVETIKHMYATGIRSCDVSVGIFHLKIRYRTDCDPNIKETILVRCFWITAYGPVAPEDLQFKYGETTLRYRDDIQSLTEKDLCIVDEMVDKYEEEQEIIKDMISNISNLAQKSTET